MVLVGADEHDRPRPALEREHADELVDRAGRPRAAEHHGVLLAAADRAVDDAPSLLAQRRRAPTRGRRLGVRVGVGRQDLVADDVLDEGERSAGGGGVGVDGAARPERPGQHDVVADALAANALDQRGHIRSLCFQAPIMSGHSMGRSGNRAASRSSADRVAAASFSVVTPWCQRGRQHAAQHAVEDHSAGRERLEPAGDVGAVGLADAGVGEEQWQPRAGAHVGARGGERAGQHPADLLDAGERRDHADGAQVVVLHDEMAARGHGVPQPRQDGDPLREVEEQQARVHEVEGRAGDRRVGRDVVAVPRALGVARAVQALERQGAERFVHVEAHDPALGPDPLGHQAHGLAGPAARVQAARAGREADLVEQAPGRRLPDERLQPQPLVLLGRAPQRVAVSLRGTHPTSRRRSAAPSQRWRGSSRRGTAAARRRACRRPPPRAPRRRWPARTWPASRSGDRGRPWASSSPPR